jgi:excisionase family DNA binding protein
MPTQTKRRRRRAQPITTAPPRWSGWQPTGSPLEVALALGVSVYTVRRWIRKGDLPAARLPGSQLLRVRISDVQSRMVSLGKEVPSGDDGPAEGDPDE